MIDKKAVLVYQGISVWTARRFDKTASDEVAAKHNAKSERAGRYNKCLIDTKHPSYLAIKKIEGEARRWHEEHTLPWSQDGARVLSSAMYMEYAAQMGTYRENFQQAVAQFVREYESMKEEAKVALNGLYRESDYPSQREIEGKFSFSISIHPVPTANDFRVEDIDEEALEAIRDNLRVEISDAAKDAERERWERLFKLVSHAVHKLSSPDAIFRDSLIRNLREAVDVLPKLSVSDDAEFEKVVGEVQTKLAVYDPQRLRDDGNVRAEAARKAAEIMRKMSAFMPKS